MTQSSIAVNHIAEFYHVFNGSGLNMKVTLHIKNRSHRSIISSLTFYIFNWPFSHSFTVRNARAAMQNTNMFKDDMNYTTYKLSKTVIEILKTLPGIIKLLPCPMMIVKNLKLRHMHFAPLPRILVSLKI